MTDSYEIGILHKNYNFFKNESCEDLNPCKVFFSDSERNEQDEEVKVAKETLKFEDGKMHVGSFYQDPKKKFLTLMRYRPDVVYPVRFTENTELGEWSKYLSSSFLSITVDDGNDGDDDKDGKNGKCLQIRGCIVKKMIRNLENFNLRKLLIENSFVVDKKCTEQNTFHDNEMYRLYINVN